MLPHTSDLPGFEQDGEGPITLPGSSDPSAPRGVVRAFANAQDTVVGFELFSIPNELLASVGPSTHGESLLRPTARSYEHTANFTVIGPLGIADDDLAVRWESYDDAASEWSVVYADVFLSGHVLGIVQYGASIADADPTALPRYAQLLASRVAAPSLPPSPPDWTFQGEQTISMQGGQSGTGGASSSTLHTWFAPGLGWRVDLTNTDASGSEETIFGSDWTTTWQYNPTTNHYTLDPALPAAADPRALFLGGELGVAGPNDAASEIAAFRRIPGKSVTIEGTEIVAGRVTQRVLTSPAYCETTASSSLDSSGSITTTAPTETCSGSDEYWFDTETGWALKWQGDGPDGETYSLSTVSATFDSPIDSTLFQFTPPPGSVQDTSGDSTGAAAGGPGQSSSSTPLAGTEFALIATDNAFSATELSAPAGQQITLTLRNDGQAVHNWDLVGQKNPDGTDVKTRLLATGEQETIQFTLSPGTYLFVCDVHPTEMFGFLRVQ